MNLASPPTRTFTAPVVQVRLRFIFFLRWGWALQSEHEEATLLLTLSLYRSG